MAGGGESVVGVVGVAWTDLLYRVYWGSEGARRAC
jgi:hypothetical protein